MSAPKHPPEPPPGFVPLGDLAALCNTAAWKLLIPWNTHCALDAARQAKLDLVVFKEGESESLFAEPSIPAPAEVARAPCCAKRRHIQIFEPEALAQANSDLLADRDQRRYAQSLLERAGTNGGYRALPRTRSALKELEAAQSLFGNLSQPIQKLRVDFTLASAMRTRDFRVRPILLTGEPGVGKTHFALKLAEILGVPMRKWSAASTQASFQLTGGDTAWHHARPGMILEMLASGKSATPILILDEVDKIGSDGRYPVTPVLLDLLEPATATAFQDTYFRLAFDASRIIYVLTANDLDAVPAPLLSRVEVFDIPAPEPEQRLRLILAEARRLRRAIGKRIELDISAAEALSERSDVDLRATHRLVQDAFAIAMASGKNIAVPKVPRRVARLAIGFATDGRSIDRT
ncbi:AAA family ATPase [Ralstonia pseudosolanacearum]|uniref:AAA family ATPase n=1 Tax=Ralstonia pseudosolanacearum TaxID=1310165 RepID=UPI0005C735A9|nr:MULTISPECIES: AAA family ATPase [Ralstonia]QKL51183.1 AAA family ATPase [Ralstonia solanacearum]MDO3517066.1 AAA family ATPase [Ralstonia pseudosolanacearum]MDO3541851.1 AAA family ATPase [Ralstonia pseudosolanacearum]QKM22439.1 AAA family ATPase [Ralstonia solanacearum]QKM27247.1 AAA family ATPase [Ralstonia solanacearum]